MEHTDRLTHKPTLNFINIDVQYITIINRMHIKDQKILKLEKIIDIKHTRHNQFHDDKKPLLKSSTSKSHHCLQLMCKNLYNKFDL